MHRPTWCVATEEGRLYWDLISAAIRDDEDTLGGHLLKHPDCARLEFWYTPPIHFAVREGNLAATRVLWQAYPFEEVSELVTMAEDRGHTSVADHLRGQIGAAAAKSNLRLHLAVEAGDHEELERLLRAVPDVGTVRDRHGRTALHLAAKARDRTAIDALLAGGADLDVVDHQGFRPVHYACWSSTYWGLRKDAADLIPVFLAAGAADSPTLAAVRGDLEAVRAFTETDSSAVNDGDTLGKRPLSAAVEAGHRELVRFLLDHGATPTLPEGRACPSGSALMTASVNDDVEMAHWLLDAGADPNGDIDSSGTPAIRARSDAMRGLLYGFGGRASTAWGYVQEGDLATLAAILRYCDDPFSDEKGEFLTTPFTAVISGCARHVENGKSADVHQAMLQMFLRRKHPMPKVLTECKGYLYHVPGMTRQLLEHGLDPNLHDWQRRTPLHDLCKGHRHIEDPVPLIRMFLEFGADIDAIDEQDRSTPLGIAAREGKRDLVELLLEAGADPGAAGAPWATPAAWAERRGHAEIAELCGKR
jgi:ankyrin repeat protein